MALIGRGCIFMHVFVFYTIKERFFSLIFTLFCNGDKKCGNFFHLEYQSQTDIKDPYH